MSQQDAHNVLLGPSHHLDPYRVTALDVQRDKRTVTQMPGRSVSNASLGCSQRMWIRKHSSTIARASACPAHPEKSITIRCQKRRATRALWGGTTIS